MASFKKCKVVMLPTNKEAKIGSIFKAIKKYRIFDADIDTHIGNLTLNKNPNVDGSNEYFEHQHIYVLSDEKIHKGDWIYNSFMKEVGKALFTEEKKDPHLHKVISSSDSSLSLPLPSESFIEKYITQHNKGEKIEEVMVRWSENDSNGLIVNSSDNIVIKKIKDVWTTDEMHKAYLAGMARGGAIARDPDYYSLTDKDNFNEWIDKQQSI